MDAVTPAQEGVYKQLQDAGIPEYYVDATVPPTPSVVRGSWVCVWIHHDDQRWYDRETKPRQDPKLCKDGEAHDYKWVTKQGGGLKGVCKICNKEQP